MDFTAFKDTIPGNTVPAHLNDYLRALWYDASGDWNKAHHIIQDLEDKDAAWIHAYLHRKEGDIWNADYWYNRAGRKRPDSSLENEWEEIVKNWLVD